MTLEGEPNLDMMAQRAENLFKFKNFYDQMDISPEECLAITKAIIELINPSRGSGLIKRKSQGGDKFEGNYLNFLKWILKVCQVIITGPYM